MKEWVIKRTGPATKEIKDDKDFEKLKKSHFSVVFFGPEDELFEEYLKVAVLLQNTEFYHSHDQKYLRLNNMNTLTIFKDFEGGKVDYHGSLEMEKIEEFIIKHR